MPHGKGTFVVTMDREEVRDGIPFYVLKHGSGQESYWRKSDLAYSMDVRDGQPVMRMSPPWQTLAMPLEVSKTWEQTFVTEQKDRPNNERTVKCEIAAEESVTVPAGAFK